MSPETKEERRERNRPLAERLIRARERSPYPRREVFAQKLGVALNTVYRIERGEVVPSIETLSAWAQACGVTSDWLLGIDDSSTPAAADQPRREVNTVEPAA
jgi:transcriptional regulator with XRE-family HTH domain